MPWPANGARLGSLSIGSQAPLPVAEIVRPSRRKQSTAAVTPKLKQSGRRRDRHGPHGSQIRAGSEASDGGNVGGFAAARCLRSVDRGGSRGSRSRWTAPSMARPFGRRSACPSPALALDEGARLSTPVERFRRSRQNDPAEPSIREGRWRRRPVRRRAPQTRQGVALKAGALLVREWKGRLERVMILEEGFAWNGQTFGSL